MNREIKFRAWSIIEKEMLPFEQMCIPEWLDDEDLFLMQYVGLKDKKGKEAYEKDLAKNGKKIWIVHWDAPEARFILMPTIKCDENYKFMDEISRMEIIGNVYENAQLLQH